MHLNVRAPRHASISSINPERGCKNYLATDIARLNWVQLNWRQAPWSVVTQLTRWVESDDVITKNSAQLSYTKYRQFSAGHEVLSALSSERAQNFTTDSKLGTFVSSWVEFLEWSHCLTQLIWSAEWPLTTAPDTSWIELGRAMWSRPKPPQWLP